MSVSLHLLFFVIWQLKQHSYPLLFVIPFFFLAGPTQYFETNYCPSFYIPRCDEHPQRIRFFFLKTRMPASCYGATDRIFVFRAALCIISMCSLLDNPLTLYPKTDRWLTYLNRITESCLVRQPHTLILESHMQPGFRSVLKQWMLRWT